nr:hypothetical protein [Tanacetum cinerariifolium]
FLLTNVESHMIVRSGFEKVDEDCEDDDETRDGNGIGNDHDINVDNETYETPHVDGHDIDSNK